jgi:hypothetical protein
VIIPVGINHVVRGWPRVTIAIIAVCTLVQIYAAQFAPSPDDVERQAQTRMRDLPPAADAAQLAAAERFTRAMRSC